MIIRDPIHGDIEFNRLEQTVLDASSLQRLREIKQLGAASLVYPGCTHTRFEHSLGSFWMAKRIMGALAADGMEVSQYAQAVAIAALLHDIAFAPYGHSFEDVLGLLPKHDGQLLLEAVANGPFAEILGHELYDQLQAIFTGQAPGWTQAVIASTIDADMLDYLRRDAHYAGLGQGYDDRIFRYLTVHEGKLAVRTERDGLPRPDAVSELLNLLRLRYYLMERVYYHHAKLAAEVMLGQALMAALAGGLPVETLYRVGDQELLLTLQQFGAAPLVQAVQQRRLYKRAYVISSRSSQWQERVNWAEQLSQPAIRAEVEQALAGKGQAAVCCLPPTLMKRAAVALTAGPDLAGHSPLEVQALENSYAQLWRLYVFAPPDQCEQVQAAAGRYFDRPSEYDRRRKVQSL